MLLSLNKETHKILLPFYKYSMWASFVTWITSTQYRISLHVSFIVSRSIDWMDSQIRIVRSLMSRGNGGTYTRLLTHPHRNKSMGVKSGDLGGHSVGPPRPIHLSETFHWGNRSQNEGSGVDHRSVEKISFVQSLQEVGAWASSLSCWGR
jgi:hypothetical protein